MGEVARAIVKLANLTFLQACTARSQAFTRTLFGSYRAFSTRDRRSRAIVSTALVFSSSRILSPQRSARRLPAHPLPSLAGGSRTGTLESHTLMDCSRRRRDKIRGTFS